MSSQNHCIERPCVLVLCQLSPKAKEEIAGDSRFQVIDVVDSIKKTSSRKITGIIVRSGFAVNRQFLNLLPELKFVIRAGNGIDNIELVELERRGIRLLRNPNISAVAVAEIAFASLLSLARRIPEAMAMTMRQIWDKERLLGESLSDLSVAIWGAGPVGIACGKLLQQHCRSVVYAEWSSAPAWLPQYRPDQLLSQADVHIICVPLRPKTKEMVGKSFLHLATSQSPYIINVARYEVLDVYAVAEALLAGRLRGVAIDPIDHAHLYDAIVAFQYPQIPSNLLLLQHLGAQRIDVMDAISFWAIREARTLLDGS